MLVVRNTLELDVAQALEHLELARRHAEPLLVTRTDGLLPPGLQPVDDLVGNFPALGLQVVSLPRIVRE